MRTKIKTVIIHTVLKMNLISKILTSKKTITHSNSKKMI